MPVRNIECQIAEAQMSRYVNGDPFSSDAQRQLEDHLRECPDCGGMLRAKRAALMNLLAPTQAVVEIEEISAPADPEPIPQPITTTPKTTTEALLKLLTRPAPTAAAPVAPVREAARETVETKMEASPTRTVFAKPLILSGLLAVTLIAMSHLARNPETLFGPRMAPLGGAGVASISSPVVEPKPDETKKEEPAPVAVPETQPEAPIAMSEFVPGAFLVPIESFDGSAESLQATIDGTAEMIARMDEPEVAAPGPDPQVEEPVRVVRRPIRRTRPAAQPTANRVQIAPGQPAVRVYPPETNP